MNELIQKLIMQATNDIAPVIRESEIDYDRDFAEFAHFLSSDKNNRIFTAWKEKFAELILANHAELTRSTDPINKPFELNPKFVAKCDEIGRSRRQFQ